MFMHINSPIQAQYEQINRELAEIQKRRDVLKNQQMRLNLLNQFRQKGVTRPDYVGFQPASRQPFS